MIVFYDCYWAGDNCVSFIFVVELVIMTEIFVGDSFFLVQGFDDAFLIDGVGLTSVPRRKRSRFLRTATGETLWALEAPTSCESVGFGRIGRGVAYLFCIIIGSSCKVIYLV